MIFQDRKSAGRLLAQRLSEYQNDDVIVYGLPRGGVIPAHVVAKYLNAKLDVIFVRKIGHPMSPEYAIGGLAEDQAAIYNQQEYAVLDKKRLEAAEANQRKKL